MNAFPEYCRKIDPSNTDVDNYAVLAIYGVLNDKVTVSTGNGTKDVVKFTQFRKLIKTSIYRRAKLAPRLSDVDFEPG